MELLKRIKRHDELLARRDDDGHGNSTGAVEAIDRRASADFLTKPLAYHEPRV